MRFLEHRWQEIARRRWMRPPEPGFTPPAEWDRVDHEAALAWWEARHADVAGYESVGYAGAGDAYNAWLYRVRRHLFRRYVAPLASAEAGVLDIGSGTGFYLRRWREAGVRDLTGSDAAEAAVRGLRRSQPGTPMLRFDVAGARESLPRRRYDVVSIFDVLFHLVDDGAYLRALENLAALVAPGGLLVLSENFCRSGVRRYAAVQVNREDREIVEALRAAGFEICTRRPMFVLMNAPACGGGRLLHAWWRRAHELLTSRPRAGSVLGPALYPAELAVLRAVRRAPSTELVVCRRRP
jgi:SAM-dependent methyltransferase